MHSVVCEKQNGCPRPLSETKHRFPVQLSDSHNAIRWTKVEVKSQKRRSWKLKICLSCMLRRLRAGGLRVHRVGREGCKQRSSRRRDAESQPGQRRQQHRLDRRGGGGEWRAGAVHRSGTNASSGQGRWLRLLRIESPRRVVRTERNGVRRDPAGTSPDLRLGGPGDSRGLPTEARRQRLVFHWSNRVPSRIVRVQ